MPTGSTSGKDDSLNFQQVLGRQIQATKNGGRVVFIQSASHRVAKRLGLLENFLEHVMIVLAHLDLIGFDVEYFHIVRNDSGVAMGDLKRIGFENRDLMVGKENDSFGESN